MDGSDEKDCHHPTCGPEHFRCENARCIPKAWRCDGAVDCGRHDSSDEKDCQKNATGPCTENQFECKNGACIEATKVCDSKRDCSDGSDEDPSCGIDECLTPNICDQGCTDLPIRYKCTCNEGYKLDPANNRTCIDLDECTEGIPACSQICVNEPATFKCACNTTFYKLEGRTSCKRIKSDPEPWIVVANRHYLRNVSLDGNYQVWKIFLCAYLWFFSI